jgi:hypothetical protein
MVFPEVNFIVTVPAPRTRAWASFPNKKEVAPPDLVRRKHRNVSIYMNISIGVYPTLW